MEIDKKIIKEAAEEELSFYQEYANNHRLVSYDDTPERTLQLIMCESWARALRAAGAHTLNGKAPVAEAVVAACIHSGIDKQKVKLIDYHGLFTIEFPNLKYFIRKGTDGYTAWPAKGPIWIEHCIPIFLSPDEFAQFLHAFDALYPDIQQTTEEVIESIREIILKLNKEDMIRKLQQVIAEESAHRAA